ncbi:hypothetical protein ADIARSV_2576 [Arcticibacter svalbardensis MN12-7]|uniref:Uncharacterized protein n=1 Tax=Arcticibacter svalbardensis MN12-7 TaxID=1150600 RepID=R9GS03_9SPHI|nr:hypothetical protein ADIARSV_2576 [Arcticibacter svalbardensis MN12-7]
MGLLFEYFLPFLKESFQIRNYEKTLNFVQISVHFCWNIALRNKN